MKGYTTILAILLFTANSLFAQSPQAIPYQAVARTASGNLIANQNISVRFSIHDGNAAGPIVYSETHSATTNVLGLFSVNIGGGTAVAGTMATVNWGNGTKFLQTELDPSGGNNYIDMGTTQMMSVPYALHAKTVEQTGGKTYLILSGNISDAEAAEKIAKDVGPNTQFVKIINTTNLTSVNLSGFTDLVEVRISNNTALTTISLNNLQAVYDNIEVYNNSNLQSLSLPGLISAFGQLTINNCPNLSNLNISNLKLVSYLSIGYTGITSLSLDLITDLRAFSFDGNANLATISLSGITAVNSYSGISNNSSLTSVHLPNVTSISDGTLYITNNSSLSSLNLAALSLMSNSSLQVYYSNISTLNLPALTNLTGSQLNITGNPGLTFVNLNSLTSLTSVGHTSSFTNISNNTSLNSISLNNLNSISDNSGFQIASNPNLTSLNLNSLSTIGNSASFNLAANSFTPSTINSLLSKLANVPAFSRAYINLCCQNPSASPTGQGITDKNTLISNGNNVSTD